MVSLGADLAIPLGPEEIVTVQELAISNMLEIKAVGINDGGFRNGFSHP